MATKNAPPRTMSSFPQVAEAEKRLGDLFNKFNEAREQLLTLQAGVPKPTHVREQDHIDQLLAGEDPEAVDVEAVRAHGRRVAEQEKMVSLLKRAIEQQEMKVSAARGEASNALLRERQPELFAKSRAVIAALLRVLKLHEAEQSLRFELAQQGISGAETVWSLPVFFVHQFGTLSEPDSMIVRVLRDAMEIGILSPGEVATIRAGGELPVA
jgi:hypothetical protein